MTNTVLAEEAAALQVEAMGPLTQISRGELHGPEALAALLALDAAVRRLGARFGSDADVKDSGVACASTVDAGVEDVGEVQCGPGPLVERERWVALCRARVRAGPTAQAETVGFLHAGQVVRAVGCGGRWLRVGAQGVGIQGFVLAAYADDEAVLVPTPDGDIAG